MTEAESKVYSVLPEQRRNRIQVAVPKANNISSQGNEWLEQMSNGVLRRVSMTREDVGQEQSEYDRVLGLVIDFLIRNGGERWTAGGLERGYAGTSGVFRCSQEKLRAVLSRALDEGRLKLGGEGRGKGYLVPGGSV
jgi:hypothetical protein